MINCYQEITWEIRPPRIPFNRHHHQGRASPEIFICHEPIASWFQGKFRHLKFLTILKVDSDTNVPQATMTSVTLQSNAKKYTSETLPPKSEGFLGCFFSPRLSIISVCSHGRPVDYMGRLEMTSTRHHWRCTMKGESYPWEDLSGDATRNFSH